jgi:hypothetical protein
MDLAVMRTANAAREADEQREELLRKSTLVLIRGHLEVRPVKNTKPDLISTLFTSFLTLLPVSLN